MCNYSSGDIIKGKVTGIEEYGIFVVVDDDPDTTGLIHISEISDSFVKNVGDYAKIGDIIVSEVIEYDSLNKKLKLSIKKMNNDNKKNKGIVETKSGFASLEKNLTNWIKIKEQNLDKN